MQPFFNAVLFCVVFSVYYHIIYKKKGDDVNWLLIRELG